MSHRRTFSLVACLVTVLAFANDLGQGAGDTWPANVQVSENTGNPQSETSLAADPNDPLHLVAVWWEVIQYDPQDPGTRQKRLNWAWTRDGGLTWQSRRFENGIYSSDPAIVADPRAPLPRSRRREHRDPQVNGRWRDVRQDGRDRKSVV